MRQTNGISLHPPQCNDPLPLQWHDIIHWIRCSLSSPPKISYSIWRSIIPRKFLLCRWTPTTKWYHRRTMQNNQKRCIISSKIKNRRHIPQCTTCNKKTYRASRIRSYPTVRRHPNIHWKFNSKRYLYIQPPSETIKSIWHEILVDESSNNFLNLIW